MAVNLVSNIRVGTTTPVTNNQNVSNTKEVLTRMPKPNDIGNNNKRDSLSGRVSLGVANGINFRQLRQN